MEKPLQTLFGFFPRAGEIAISANFTKSTGSFPRFFFCLFNLLRTARVLHLELLRETLRTVSKPTTHVLGSQKDVNNMLASILGARLSWHFANGWVFEPAIVGPDIVDYTLKEGPHAGRHAIQHFYYQRVAPGVETTVWYEESGALVHITWYLETQTTHRFAALPAWLAKDMTVYRGDNQDPVFIEKIRKLTSTEQDWPRHILNDEGYFKVI
jgi:phenolic acid decarboxylase